VKRITQGLLIIFAEVAVIIYAHPLKIGPFSVAAMVAGDSAISGWFCGGGGDAAGIMEKDDYLLQQRYRSTGEKIYFKLRGWLQTHSDLRPLLLFESAALHASQRAFNSIAV
jgi:hypothetical protein